jgi:hypothetical protein
MVAPYAIDGQSIRFDKPRRLSQRRVSARPRIASYDLHPDGTRFAVAALPAATEKAAEDKVVFVFDFFNELKRVAPAKE